MAQGDRKLRGTEEQCREASYHPGPFVRDAQYHGAGGRDSNGTIARWL